MSKVTPERVRKGSRSPNPRAQRSLWGVALALVSVLSGCGGGDEPPMVTYDPPGPAAGEEALTIKVDDNLAAGAPAVTIQLPQGIRSRQWLVLEGVVDAGDPAQPANMILANMTNEYQGRRVIAGSAICTGEVIDGKVKYRLEIQCPPIPGRFLLELSQLNGNSQTNRVFAQGELQVK